MDPEGAVEEAAALEAMYTRANCELCQEYWSSKPLDEVNFDVSGVYQKKVAS